jgi:cytosine deaminase
MYWYWQNKKILNLPEPNQLTIITSLDPCPICAASIILSGFNVGTVSMDPYGGVNFKRDGFNSFSFAPKIQQELIQRFGYYQIEGDESRKRYEYGA